MQPLNHSSQNCKLFLNRLVETLSRNRATNLTQNEHVYAIFCRQEVGGDIISGGYVNTTEGYVHLNCEAASVSSFLENQNQPFV